MTLDDDGRRQGHALTRRPGVVPTLAAVALVALTVALGNWQRSRAQEKAMLSREYDARMADEPVRLGAAPVDPMQLRFRRVRVEGEYDAGRTVLIDNRVYRGTPGYHVVTPLRIGGSDLYVLVNRGWIAGSPRRDVLPEVDTPGGRQVVEGMAVVPPERVFELAPDPEGSRVRQNLRPGRLAAEWRVALHPVVIQQTSDAHDGLVRDWGRPDTGIDKHRAYALQWYSLAALTVVLYVFLGFRKRAGR